MQVGILRRDNNLRHHHLGESPGDRDCHARLSKPDYRYMREFNEGIGVLVIGRRMFDRTDGWGGRHPFDRQIVVDLPDLRGREGILRVHIRNKPMAEDVDVTTLARGTPGMGPVLPVLDRPLAPRDRAASRWR